MKRLTLSSTLAVVTIAIALVAPAQLASAAERHTTATTIQVRSGEMFFRLSAKSASSGRVTFVVRNTGKMPHDFKISGKKTPMIRPGKTARLLVTLKKGKYRYLCTVPGHAAAGMRGVFTVR